MSLLSRQKPKRSTYTIAERKVIPLLRESASIAARVFHRGVIYGSRCRVKRRTPFTSRRYPTRPFLIR